jgi:hypothetical protein
MQNSDILDGKRWNATLDQKTAPKDADNDGEIFDLDYDTPENPAVPGKRIPNHPNCRCRYTPVISALGVQKEKGRIAKDPKDKSREYFKGNYREYAKFKNLPDLDERLKAENPARYLRPGEKLEDLNKQVVRRTVNNREITIPRPMWERLEKPPASIPPIVEPTAATVTNVLGKLPVNKNSSIYQKVGEGHYNNIQAVVEKAPQDVRQVWAKFESKLTFIDVDSWEHPHCNYGRNRGVVMNIKNDVKEGLYHVPYSTMFHESGHNIDVVLMDKQGTGLNWGKFSATYKEGLFQKTLKQEVEDHINTLDKVMKAEFKKNNGNVDWLKQNGYWTSVDEFNLTHGIPVNTKYSKALAYSKFQKKLRLIPERNRSEISDIVEGCTDGRVEAGFGHGKSYWKDGVDRIGAEAFAEFFESSLCNPEARAILNEYFPKAAKIFDEMMEIAIKEAIE